MSVENDSNLILLEGRQIRKTLHIDEIENPELSMARMQELYEKKG